MSSEEEVHDARRSTVGSRFHARRRAERAIARRRTERRTEQRDRLLAAIARAETAVAAAAAAVQATSSRLQVLQDEKEMNDLIAYNGGNWAVD